MKTKKEDTTPKKSVLKKVVKSKRKIATPKAGASLEKAVQNVQQIFKKKNIESKTIKKIPTEKKISPRIPNSLKKKKQWKSFDISKGIVYVGHIPHGFYEEQMKDYFQQFGKVMRVRVARSKKTGRSRGYGYVEFLNKDVAKIAAETMNNYLMFGRLLKATYIPPEKQHFGFFAGNNWSTTDYPKLKNRKKEILNKNSLQNDEDYKKYVEKSLRKLSNLENKLQNKGIKIKFQPVDVPKT